MITKKNINAVKKIAKLYNSVTKEMLLEHIGENTKWFKNKTLYKGDECPGCTTCNSCEDCAIKGIRGDKCIHQKSYKDLFENLFDYKIINTDNVSQLVKLFHKRAKKLNRLADIAEKNRMKK